jgi:hypothetical protein
MVRAEIKRQKANIINARPNDHSQRDTSKLHTGFCNTTWIILILSLSHETLDSWKQDDRTLWTFHTPFN